MSQSLSNVLVHLVFSTKHRSPKLSVDVRADLHRYLSGILENHGCNPIEVGGVADHVHILFTLSRTITIAKAVEEVKGGSSKWLKSQGAWLQDFSWQAGYGTFSVGIRQVDAVRHYIQNQEEHHRRKTFQEEYRELLTEAGIPFDERYVWD